MISQSYNSRSIIKLDCTHKEFTLRGVSLRERSLKIGTLMPRYASQLQCLSLLQWLAIFNGRIWFGRDNVWAWGKTVLSFIPAAWTPQVLLWLSGVSVAARSWVNHDQLLTLVRPSIIEDALQFLKLNWRAHLLVLITLCLAWLLDIRIATDKMGTEDQMRLLINAFIEAELLGADSQIVLEVKLVLKKPYQLLLCVAHCQQLNAHCLILSKCLMTRIFLRR